MPTFASESSVADVDVEKSSLENMPANLYESVCVPDLGDFLGYQNAANAVSTPEHKSPATPASSTTSNSSGPANASQAPAVPLPPRQYHAEGESTLYAINLNFLPFLHLFTTKQPKRCLICSNADYEFIIPPDSVDAV